MGIPSFSSRPSRKACDSGYLSAISTLYSGEGFDVFISSTHIIRAGCSVSGVGPSIHAGTSHRLPSYSTTSLTSRGPSSLRMIRILFTFDILAIKKPLRLLLDRAFVWLPISGTLVPPTLYCKRHTFPVTDFASVPFAVQFGHVATI